MLIHKLFAGIVFACICILLSGCASDSNASKGAAQGAAKGAMVGAVGGLIGALVFGGDPAEKAARGAVYGGTTGAIAGAIAGQETDNQIKAEQDASLESLRNDIGEDAFEGLSSLAECEYEVTLDMAAKAQQSNNPNYRLAGLWLETLSYADSRQEQKARGLLPDIVEQDWDMDTENQAEEVMRQGIVELVEIRKEFNLPPVCSS